MLVQRNWFGVGARGAAAFLFLACGSPFLPSAGHTQGGATVTLPRVAEPPAGQIYHGVFPGGTEGVEDGIRPEALAAYERASGRQAAWAYFSHEWINGRGFPRATAEWVSDSGSVPYIRLMIRGSNDKALQNRPRRPRSHQPDFPLADIAEGRYDRELHAWFREAREFGKPLIVEFGTEVNGWWFPWNAGWNGVDDGAARFVAAYRHIVTIACREGADNVRWVFHVNDNNAPVARWNQAHLYYPGDEYVDWVAVSVYGAQTITSRWTHFGDAMQSAYDWVSAAFPGKPIILAEFGATAGHPRGALHTWADAALAGLVPRQRWPRVIGFSWWNEGWENHDDTRTNMRVQDDSATARVFKARLRDPRVLDRAVTTP